MAALVEKRTAFTDTAELLPFEGPRVLVVDRPYLKGKRERDGVNIHFRDSWSPPPSAWAHTRGGGGGTR